MSRPGLTVLIVAYGDPTLLARCLRCLGPGLDVVLVDNSSSEEVQILAQGAGARYFDSGRNLGFAAGVNRGLDDLGPPWPDVLLLNPDAEIQASDVIRLQAFLREPGRERVGCVSPRLVDARGEAVRVRWPFPSPAQAWLDAAGLGRLPRSRGFLIGPVLLLRSEALEAVGWFDEGFFLYQEEADWQRRAVSLGWSNEICSSVAARHTGGATADDESNRQVLFHAAVERYVRKWFGPDGWTIFRLGVMLGALIRSLTGPRRALHRERFRRYLQGPLRAGSSPLS